MSVIILKLKHSEIDKSRYEEYIWLNGKCYSVFKDGRNKYTVSIDGVSLKGIFFLKRDALKALSNIVMEDNRR